MSMSRDPEEQPVKGAAKTGARAILWVVVAVFALALVVGIFMLGPLGLVIVVPAVLVIWGVAAVTAGGPAAGA